MSKHELGADRVLHEGAGYRDKYKFKSRQSAAEKIRPTRSKRGQMRCIYPIPPNG